MKCSAALDDNQAGRVRTVLFNWCAECNQVVGEVNGDLPFVSKFSFEDVSSTTQIVLNELK